ncbi:hypothetical protein ABLG96_07675 [Nakamurella sp. A5-74]|uniref:TOMM leader peptide-binding protein n=1 Tax=Nakamurella sp. A5-74 TaxID=3158264 RepID=A0AAU8DUV9_9ACTN
MTDPGERPPAPAKWRSPKGAVIAPVAAGTLPRYRLGTGIRLIPRGADLQIGTAAGRRLLLADAPPRAARILQELDGTHSADHLLTGADDRRWWYSTFRQLYLAGILHGDDRAPQVGPGLVDERIDLTHRHGADAADLALGRRCDAIVEIRGAGRIAGLVAGLLVAAGIGQVQLTKNRPARASDTLVAVEPGRASEPAGNPPSTDGAGLLTTSASSPAQLRPTVVVLAGDAAAEYTDARDLMTARVPHLALGAADGRAVVGPLVLPGRSSCLWCLDLWRADRDPDWATLRLATSSAPGVPSAVLAAGAAALGTAEVLHVVEGIRHPLTVDGTLEWDAATLPRRRTWQPHPECGCTDRP